MSLEERQSFLAEVHVGVFAVEREGRAPLAVPVWYDYEPGGELMIWMDRDSVKYKSIDRAPRFSFLVQQEEPPYKYVTAEGAAIVDGHPPTRDQALRIARRYLAGAEAVGYVEDALRHESILVRMRPQKWLSGDYGKEAAARS